MAEINLAPGSEYVLFARRRRRRVYALTVLIALLVGLTWGGLFLLRGRYAGQHQDLTEQVAGVEAEILRLGDQAQRVQLFEERLTAIAGLLDNHIAWDPFLKELERILPPPAAITRLGIDTGSHSVELAGEAPDIDVVAQTLASVISTPARPTAFTAATLGSVSRLEQTTPDGQVVGVRYTFTANLILDPKYIQYGQ